MSRAERRPSAVAQFFTRIKWTYVIVSVFFLVLGILLLVRPEASLTVICRGLGILTAVFGVIRVLQYILRAPDGIGQRYDLAGGLFCLFIAALLIFRAREVAASVSPTNCAAGAVLAMLAVLAVLAAGAALLASVCALAAISPSRLRRSSSDASGSLAGGLGAAFETSVDCPRESRSFPHD